MLKITDTNYSLPNIMALSGSHVLTSGTTQPMLIRGVDIDSGARNQYVVKFMKAPRMSPSSACYEILGVWIGKELGLNVSEPVLVNINQEFVDSIAGRNGYQNARNSIGINYGSVYVEGYMELPNGKSLLSSQLLEEAKQIFAFDMFISNADRGAGKPNVLTNGNNFMIYDHELAFSFIMLLPFLRNKTPWVLGEAEREMYEKHHFYPYLRNSNIDFNEFTERFLEIDDYFWKRVSKFIPNEWYSEQIQEIKEYLKVITEHRKTFAEQLTKVLLT
ncbi:HipA family kinase [Arcicella lustrica]|uniref:HipA family kinase n=1 Tax=Arcicella lustrica TaxID=2984196 RepID=A0ABU5SJX7_9BACT|nr:HipA family kinase [Arcicella sp. DC25W]MEA5427329.1 HipA family kinase [Arcicella sp. DC25W]